MQDIVFFIKADCDKIMTSKENRFMKTIGGHTMNKRFGAITLASVLAMTGFTACSGTADGESQQTSNKETVITFGGPNDWLDESVTAVIDKFQEESGVTVDVQRLSTQTDTIIQTKLATNECYDVFFQHGGGYAYTWFRPQVNCVDLSGEEWAGKINSGIRETMLDIEGKLFYLPFGVNTLGVMYNKDIYEELDLSIPTTWDETLANCKTIKDAGYTPFYLAAKDVWPITAWPFAEFSYAIQKDSELMNKINSNQAKFSDVQELKDSGNRLQELQSLGYFQEGVLSSTYDQAVEAFGTEKAAMVCIMDSFANDVVAKYPDLNFGAFPFPKGESPVVTAINPRSVFIWKGTEHLDEAKSLLSFMAETENYTSIMERNPAIPCMDGIEITLNPAAQDYLPYRDKGGFITIFEELIVVGIDESLRESCQDVISGADSSQLGEQMDMTFQKNAKAQKIEGFN